jgi:death on curing protein
MSDLKEPNWLNFQLIIAVQAKQIEQFGGSDGIRDEELIHSALARPQQWFHYGSPPEDIFALAACYAFGFVKNHVFIDGNKRIAHMAYRLFLAKNGYRCPASSEEKYTRMIALASSKITEGDFADWLRGVCAEI